MDTDTEVLTAARATFSVAVHVIVVVIDVIVKMRV